MIACGVAPAYDMAYTYDGIKWFKSTLGHNTLFGNSANCVAWNGSIWLAGGTTSPITSGKYTLLYSSDGINWVGVPGALNILDYSILQIAWNSILWVAVGLAHGGPPYYSAMYSYDGINWTLLSDINNRGQGWSVCWNGILWLIGVYTGSSGIPTIFYSYNGINWTVTSNSNSILTGSCNSLAWNGKMFVGVGYSSAYAVGYSYDGLTWVGAVATSGLLSQGHGVAWNGSMWVVVGYSTSSCIAYSYDGINWSASANANVIFGEGFCQRIAWNGSLWIASSRVGYGNATSSGYSYNGINWFASTDSVINAFTSIGYLASRRILPYVGTSPFGNRGPTGANRTILYGSGTTSSGTLAVTFTRPFVTAPNVTANVVSSSAGFVTLDSITRTGFTAYTFNGSGAISVAFSWTAVL
jgi:hypothetical protein